ncbi:MAG TPA: hypothetical protein VK390_01680 [Propionibacteriaceae bacterium]|nr:hypothetical protein [Propionibacteriaceae bacterium]
MGNARDQVGWGLTPERRTRLALLERQRTFAPFQLGELRMLMFAGSPVRRRRRERAAEVLRRATGQQVKQW